MKERKKYLEEGKVEEIKETERSKQTINGKKERKKK